MGQLTYNDEEPLRKNEGYTSYWCICLYSVLIGVKGAYGLAGSLENLQNKVEKDTNCTKKNL